MGQIALARCARLSHPVGKTGQRSRSIWRFPSFNSLPGHAKLVLGASMVAKAILIVVPPTRRTRSSACCCWHRPCTNYRSRWRFAHCEHRIAGHWANCSTTTADLLRRLTRVLSLQPTTIPIWTCLDTRSDIMATLAISSTCCRERSTHWLVAKNKGPAV